MMCRLRAAFSLWGWFEVAATRLIALHKNKGMTVAACLKNRTDYIENPDKTEQGQFVSSYACGALTADEEFMLTKRQYDFVNGRRQKSDVIAYQIRQSFRPGEITAEEANKVGHELAMRFTKGKYAFVVATHTDRQHIHNHVIFNSTALDAEFAELLTKKKAAYPDYRKARDEMQELVRAQKNVERFFAEEKDTTEKTQIR